MNITLQQISDKTSLTYAIAIDLLGLLQLDTNHPAEAVDSFLSCLRIRQSLLPSSDEFVASSLNHVSLAFTELRDWEQAARYQQKAMDIRRCLALTIKGSCVPSENLW